MGGGLFFHDVNFEVLHLPVYNRNTKEGKCGAAFTDCSWKIPHRLPAKKPAEKEKGGGTKIPVVRSFFTQQTSKAKAATEASFRVRHTIVKNNSPSKTER